MSEAEAAPSLRRLVETCGLFVDSGRHVVRFSGDRALAALKGLLTADLDPVATGSAVFTLALSPKGRVLAEGRILPVGSDLWFDIAVPALDQTLQHLGQYLPPRFARFEVDESIVRAVLIGPKALDVYAAWSGSNGLKDSAPVQTGTTSIDITTVGGDRIVAVAREPREGGGVDLFVAGSEARVEEALARLESTCVEAGGGAIDPAAFDVWRVERGIPVYGRDIGPERLPQETGLDHAAISYEKGCYTGQEVVARIHYRGHVNRHLRGLRSTDPIPGDGRLFDGPKDVGLVTSATHSVRLGHVALGYVRHEVEPGSTLATSPDGERTVEVVLLPFTTT